MKCPKCGNTTNLHYNYDWSDPNDTIYSDILCNECGEYFDKPDDVREDDVEKLAEEEYPNIGGTFQEALIRFSRSGFVRGYNKAKENTYTKEQLIKAISMAKGEDGNENYDVFQYTTHEIIQSLKQPK